jgi:hypothetical protein
LEQLRSSKAGLWIFLDKKSGQKPPYREVAPLRVVEDPRRPPFSGPTPEKSGLTRKGRTKLEALLLNTKQQSSNNITPFWLE